MVFTCAERQRLKAKGSTGTRQHAHMSVAGRMVDAIKRNTQKFVGTYKVNLPVCSLSILNQSKSVRVGKFCKTYSRAAKDQVIIEMQM